MDLSDGVLIGISSLMILGSLSVIAIIQCRRRATVEVVEWSPVRFVK